MHAQESLPEVALAYGWTPALREAAQRRHLDLIASRRDILDGYLVFPFG